MCKQLDRLCHATAIMLVGGAALVLPASCDRQHDLGAIDAGTSSQAELDGGPPAATQSWTGYFENLQLSLGSDAITIRFTAGAAGAVVGTAILGNGSPPPPATDPNVGYPPGLAVGAPDPIVVEGFGYPMHDASLVGHRLRFTVALADVWTGWCALQTPVDDSLFSCIPNWAMTITTTGCTVTDPSTSAPVPIDCLKLRLCESSLCRCTPAGCTLSDSWYGLTFDLTFSGAEAAGSVQGLIPGNTGGTTNVHLIQDAP
jgi:hypothetical protein